MRVSSNNLVLGLLAAVTIGGCATLPPGSDYPKQASVAFAYPEKTRIGRQMADGARDHQDRSAFRIISVGADGFAARMQMIDAAERTLDLQYFIFSGDETGRLLTHGLIRAADRGVHVRVLVDDGQTRPGDEQIITLAAHAQVEIRIFNPFAYRGHNNLLRGIEFTFSHGRLDYRMHNKVIVADNSVALIGGRNIGNQYFQVDPDAQYADDDVFVGGPTVQKLSTTFDEFWNSALAIPVEALAGGKPTEAALAKQRQRLPDQWEQAQTAAVPFVLRAESGDPFAGVIQGRLPVAWSTAQVVYDSPNKKQVKEGSWVGRLMYDPVAKVGSAAQTELLMITPYFVPTTKAMQLLHSLRARNVRVRILTNSLETSKEMIAFSGYTKYRKQLVEDGIELHEIRALLGNTRGSGQTVAISRAGNYGLHAKLFVFDRQKVFIGSMNFDQHSVELNTEVGLIIDSAELAQQTVVRFDAMTQPANSYQVALAQEGTGKPRLVWRSQEDGKPVEYTREPAYSDWQRVEVDFLSLLPLNSEL